MISNAFQPIYNIYDYQDALEFMNKEKPGHNLGRKEIEHDLELWYVKNGMLVYDFSCVLCTIYFRMVSSSIQLTIYTPSTVDNCDLLIMKQALE